MPDTETSKADAAWAARLRERNLRVTRARLDILRVLSASPTPMQAQDVLEALNDAHADRVTVYRTLNSLIESGIAHKVDPGDRVWRYGLMASHGATGSGGSGISGSHTHDGHAHFVCDECGTVRCLEDATIKVSLGGKGEGEKFKVTQRDVYLHGTCEKCLEE